MYIILLIAGVLGLTLGVYLKINPKERYPHKNYLGNIILWGKRKEIQYDKVAIINILSYEIYPIFIFAGIYCLIISTLLYFYNLPKQYEKLHFIFYLIGYFYFFVTFYPSRIYNKIKNKTTEFVDIEAFKDFYKNPEKLSPKISIKKEWYVNYWIFITIIFSGILLVLAYEPSLKTFLAIILILSTIINIKYIEKISFNYNFILKQKEWSKYIKKMRTFATIFMVTAMYCLLIIILFYKLKL